MSAEHHPGRYEDKHGHWVADRRSVGDSRSGVSGKFEHNQRGQFRRKADRELYERVHKGMTREALEDFDSKHDGRL